MKLVPLFWKSWSFWLMILTSILGAIEVALPLFNGVFPPKTFAIASLITGIAAAVARTIQQKSMHDEKPD
jgi:hypothetical protein